MSDETRTSRDDQSLDDLVVLTADAVRGGLGNFEIQGLAAKKAPTQAAWHELVILGDVAAAKK